MQAEKEEPPLVPSAGCCRSEGEGVQQLLAFQPKVDSQMGDLTICTALRCLRKNIKAFLDASVKNSI